MKANKIEKAKESNSMVDNKVNDKENGGMKMNLSKVTTKTKIGLGVTGAVGLVAVFNKKYRKAIVAGMAMGVVTNVGAKIIIKQAMKNQAVKEKVEEVVGDLKDAYEEKKAEMAANIIMEEYDLAAEENKAEASEDVEVEDMQLMKEKFEAIRKEVYNDLATIADNMEILDKRTASQNESIKTLSKLMQETAREVFETYSDLQKEIRVLGSAKQEAKEDIIKAVKEHLAANRKEILDELGVKGSDLISCIDVEKFSNEAIMAATMEIVGNNFVDVVVDRVNQQMVSVMRKEIKETGIAKELDKVKAFIEVLKEGKDFEGK